MSPQHEPNLAPRPSPPDAAPALAQLVDGMDCMVFRLRNDALLSPEYLSAGAHTVTGYEPGQFISGAVSFAGLACGGDGDRMAAAQAFDGAHSGRYMLDYRLRRADEQVRCIKERGCLVRNDAGEVTHFEGFAEDVTERQLASEWAQREAKVDALTGLPNRRSVHESISQSLLNAETSRGSVAVVFVDLDEFKHINDSFGHEVGDRMLQDIAQRLVASLRQGDVVARLGGDEFVLLLTGFQSREELSTVLQRVGAAVALPWRSGRHDLQLSCSMGVACFPADGLTVEQLLRNADAAMYEAKQNGRNRVHYFTPELNRAIVTRVSVEHRLRNALERNQLQLHYQPRIDALSGRVVGAEALLRWQLPRQGLVMPARFIAVAEETGLIVPIGAWVLRTACLQARHWIDMGHAPVIVSVNVSPRQIREGRIVATIDAALREANLPPELLQIELTENLAMQGAEGVISLLNEIRTLGVQIAIDDFGTGYSSLSYLKRFPVDQLKVDRSFVTGLPDDREDAAIVRAIVTLGHELGLRVVAEGVESISQCEFLRAAGCDELQGYHFGRPVAPNEFRHFLAPAEAAGDGEHGHTALQA